MYKKMSPLVKLVILLLSVFLVGFAAYRGYELLIENATRRIKQGVAEGVSKGVGSAINPLSWPGKFLRGVGIKK